MALARPGARRRGWSPARKRTRRCLAVVLGGVGLMTLAGCSHDDFLPTLSFGLPEKFEGSPRTAPAKISRWWAQLRSSELNRLVALADIDNLDIAVAVAQLEAAQAQAEIAGAALWPTLNYVDNNTRSRASGTNTPGVTLPASQRNNFTKELSASYIVDLWGQNRALLDAAMHTASASAYQIEVVRLTALVTVVNNYLLFLGNNERVEVANRNLANAERILKVIQERYAAGTASDFEVAQQGALTESQRAAIPPLRQAAENAVTAIALATGRPVQEINLKSRNLRGLRVPTVTPGLPSSLLLRRPDVRNAEQSLAAADANVEAARKAFFPTITLTGLLGYQSALISTLVKPQSLVFNAAANITQPIFDGGRLRGQLSLNEAQRQQLLETYRRSILQSLVDVENALIAIRENAAREAAQRRAVVLARQAFALGEQRLGQGTIDLSTLLTTQNTLFQAEDLLIQVRLARLQAVVSLYQALGGDWQEVVEPPIGH